MIKKLLLLSAALPLVCSSCLKLQVNEKYEGKALDREVHMTCWEFMESRPDLFSDTMEGISMCGLEDCYKQTSQQYTFLLLTNTAVASMVNNARMYPSESATENLRAVFLFHIVRGTYDSYTNLDYTVTFVQTLLDDEDAKMSLCITDHVSNKEYYGRVAAMTDCGSSKVRYSVASNYLATNGPVHIFDEICSYTD